MKKLFTLLILVFVFEGIAKVSLDEKRNRILSIIDEELSEVKRLSNQEHHENPNLLLRAAELNMEKARLYRDQENEKYLSIPAEKRDQNRKDEFFQTSAKYFKEGNAYGLKVVKNFPKYKKIGDVYYVLAFNSKELNDYQEAQKYLALAVQYTGKGSPTFYKAQLALAESYFNAKEFAKAFPLYQSSVGKIDEKWWTKDAYNMAWCAYRLKNYDKAIEIMKEVVSKSASAKYINMRVSGLRDISLFFADAQRVQDGIKYFSKEKDSYANYIGFIAPTMISQGRFNSAQTLITEVKKSEANENKRINISFYELDLYDKSEQYEQHLAVAKELAQYYDKKLLSEDQVKVLKFQVTKKAAQLQKATTGEFYKNVPEVRKKRATQAIEYFALQGKFEQTGNADAIFYQAETAYGSENINAALPLYISAFDAAKTQNKSALITKTLEGMLATLGDSRLSKNIAESYYAPVYERYLSVDNSSDKAKTIYQKLFKVYLEKKDYVKCEQVAAMYAAKYTDDYQTQEAMIAPVMENYRQQKNYSKVKEYISLINAGKFKVSTKYANTLRALLTKIQIEDVQNSMEKGDKVTALKGYIKIYNDPESTPKAKTNAAYNLAVLYYEVGDVKESYNWSTVAIRDMDHTDVLKFADSFLAISSMLFARQKFTPAADVSQRLLVKICADNSSYKNMAFKNGIYLALAEGNMNQSEEFMSLAERCAVDPNIIAESRLELVKEYIKQRKFESAEMHLVKTENNQNAAIQSIPMWDQLKKVYLNVNNLEKAQEIFRKEMKIFDSAKAKKMDIPLEAADAISEESVGKIAEMVRTIEAQRLAFPEDNFNKLVKFKLAELDKLTVEVGKIRNFGSGKSTVASMVLLIKAYENFATELKNFVPEGKGPEYVTSFQNAMAKVYGPLFQNAGVQRQEVRGLINKYKILTQDNFPLLHTTNDRFVKKYFYQRQSVLMDRGGKR